MISIFQLNRSGVHHKQSALRRISDSSTVSFVAPKFIVPSLCSGPILSPRQGQKQQKPQNFGFGLRAGQDGADLDWTGLNRVPIDDSKSPRRRRVHLHGLLVRPSSGPTSYYYSSRGCSLWGGGEKLGLTGGAPPADFRPRIQISPSNWSETREDPQTQHVSPRQRQQLFVGRRWDDEEVAARCFNSIKMWFCVSHPPQLALHSNDIAQYESRDWIVMAAGWCWWEDDHLMGKSNPWELHFV